MKLNHVSVTVDTIEVTLARRTRERDWYCRIQDLAQLEQDTVFCVGPTAILTGSRASRWWRDEGRQNHGAVLCALDLALAAAGW